LGWWLKEKEKLQFLEELRGRKGEKEKDKRGTMVTKDREL